MCQFVFVSICLYVWLLVCVYVYVFVCVCRYIGMFFFNCTCVYVCKGVSFDPCVFMLVFFFEWVYKSICFNLGIRVYLMLLHINSYVFQYSCICVNVLGCVFICACTCILVFVCFFVFFCIAMCISLWAYRNIGVCMYVLLVS